VARLNPGADQYFADYFSLFTLNINRQSGHYSGGELEKEAAAIIIMAKQPRVGKTKTRLCPPFTLEQAAALAEALFLDTVDLVTRNPGMILAVAVTPAEARAYFEQITPPGALLLPVQGSSIGECLSKVLQSLLNMGFAKAVALNADGPSLPPEYLRQSVDLLDAHDLVLGPSSDGGYYLIGMKKFFPEVFEDITWSTESVLAQTLVRAESLGLRSALAPEWYDVDTAKEVWRLAAELDQIPAQRLVHTRQFLNNFDWKGYIP
jgi:uncharacterized protein